jgi:hypothetical protein
MEPQVSERRVAPRTAMTLECTLHRRRGAPICCETIDVGPGGMSVASDRPLADDELLAFDLPAGASPPLTGSARVLRQQAHRVYALRFEALQAPVREGLERLAAR